MRSSLIALIAAGLASGPVLAQARVNLAEIYPAATCTNYTSRGTLGGNAGEILLEWPESHFSGVGHDLTGNGTILTGFTHVVQDQNAATTSTYSLLLRRAVGGRPSTDAAGILLQTSSLSLPQGTGTIAWIITHDFASPTTVLPTCDTFYMGVSTVAAPWPNDGLSWHMATATTVGGTQGDNPANDPRVPNLAWDRVAGSAVATQPTPRTYRFGLRVGAAVLNLGNIDLGWISGCGRLNNFTSYGLGGMWPQITGPRADGLWCRVRDAASAQGSFVLLSSPLLACPGIPLPSLASGALYLYPDRLVPMALGSLGPDGEGTTQVASPGTIPTALAGRLLDFQAFTLGSAGVLPGRLSNRASTRFF